MEEEKVEVKVQEEEVEDRERRENRQPPRSMTHGWNDAHKHLSQCRVTHYYKCARYEGEKGDV